MAENSSQDPRAVGQETPPPEAAVSAEALPEEPQLLVGGTMAGTILNRVMPWVISVLLHAGLVLIMLFVTMIAFQDPIPKGVIVPDANYVDNPGGQMRPAESVQEKESDAARAVERRYQTSEKVTDNKSQRLAVIAAGARTQGGGQALPETRAVRRRGGVVAVRRPGRKLPERRVRHRPIRLDGRDL